MQASEEVVTHAGGPWDASLNFYNSGGNCMVATQQIDQWVYVVGQDDFDVARYTLGEWLGEAARDPDPQVIECNTAEMAWELLRVLREDCFLWQCGGCDAWIFTSNRARLGVLRCSTCGDSGVDFRHADRHVGGDGEEA